MRLLTIAGLLFSTQAFACPDLAGAFTCKYNDGSQEVITITQDLKAAVPTYNLNGSEVLADNIAKPMADDANIRNSTVRAWCDDDVTLKAEMLGQYFNNGTYYGDLTLNLGFTLTNGDFSQSTVGQ